MNHLEKTTYIIVNDRNMFFRGTGFNRRNGQQWVTDMISCKHYDKLSSAKKCLSYFKRHPSVHFAIPKIEKIFLTAKIIENDD